MKKLSKKQILVVSVMLFGMFFGAGNLIFPVHLGQLAGSNVWAAAGGFIITGVGLPILAVAALGITRSDGLQSLAGKVGKKYAIFFTCLLCLTIGPFFAIPRTCTVPFTIAIQPFFTTESGTVLPLLIFSLIFFVIVLILSLKPNSIETTVGKVLTPIFLVLLGVLVVACLIHPMGNIADMQPDATYATGSFMNGFLEGYNTMDCLAGLIFGIVIVNVINYLGVDDPESVAGTTIKAGLLSGIIMALIYVAITLMGTQSLGVFKLSENGGIALAEISGHYFGKAGTFLLAGIATFACLKTAIALVVSISNIFTGMFPKGPKYKTWVIIICLVSFGLANFGLTAIIAYAVPVLMFLYPLAMTLIILALTGKWFNHHRAVYVSVTAFTLAAALVDFFAALPEGIITALNLGPAIESIQGFLPLSDIGLGWVVPAVIGLMTGLIIMAVQNGKTHAATE